MVGKEQDKKRRGHRFDHWLRFSAYVLFTVVFLVSSGMILLQYSDFWQSMDEYEKAREIAEIPDMIDHIDALAPDTDIDNTLPNVSFYEESTSGISAQSDNVLDENIMECLNSANIKALQAVNPDVIGWIYITATDISYPIMHADSNDRYIRSSWMDSSVYLTAGAIFMDYRNDSDFSDFNTIIYGHRMRNETMFGKLKYYSSRSFWQAHPSIYTVTDDGVSRYDIYSVYEVSTDGETFQIGFGSSESKQAYIDFTLASSVYDTGIVPTVDDHILTLTTCSGIKDYSTRWIVQAVKACADEKEDV